MASDLSTLFITFAESPGHLVYHLLMCLGLLFCMLWVAVKISHPSKKKTAKHLLIGIIILLAIQLALFLISLLTSADIFQTSLTYAVVERLCAGLSVIWLIWMLQDDKRRTSFHGIALFISLTLILVSIATLLFINWLPDVLANSFHLIDIIWQSVFLFLTLVGIILNLFHKSKQWVAGLVLLVLLGLGHIFQIIIASAGEIHMGAVRFTQILSVPFLILFVIQQLGQTDKIARNLIAERKAKDIPLDTKPNLMNLMLSILQEDTVQGRISKIIQAISLGVVADVCYITRVQGAVQDIELIAGYDLIQERFLPSISLSPDDLPQITAAWNDNQVLQRSQAQLDDRDFETLIKLLNYFRTGNVLAIPLALPDNTLSGGIIFLSPYTNKHWGQETLTLLDEIKDHLTRALFSQSPLEKFKADLDDVKDDKLKLITEKGTLSELIADKEIALNHQEKYIQQLQSQFQEEKLEAERVIIRLQSQAESLKAQLSSQPDSEALEQMQNEIRHLTSENDQLQITLSRANARIKDLETQTGQTGPIRLSMQNQILSLDSVAANVKLQINPQLQQGHLKLEIINPDGRQMIKTDPELLQNILLGLLTNAMQASEPGSAIQLNQKLSFETGMLILEVTDFGDGLTSEEQKAFFSADYTDIPGIGSISAIRDAIRAIRVLNGKIWLRSKKWNFTTFRVQLPVRIID